MKIEQDNEVLLNVAGVLYKDRPEQLQLIKKRMLKQKEIYDYESFKLTPKLRRDLIIATAMFILFMISYIASRYVTTNNMFGLTVAISSISMFFMLLKLFSFVDRLKEWSAKR